MSLLGFDSKGLRTKLRHKDTAFAGASSGFLTRAICQPLDVLKIRFQLQLEGKDKAKYKSVTQATRRIVIDEGFGALWKGHVPAQCLSLTYGFGQFLGLELMTQWAHSFAPWTTEREYKPVVHALCGMPAGALGTLLSQPFDVVRTRLVAQGTKARVYRGVFDAMAQIVTLEGPLALYRGFVPSLTTAAPYSGLQFGFYTLFVQVLEPLVIEHEDEDHFKHLTSGGAFVCGFLAGIVAKTLVFPFDTAKKRLQIMGFEKGLEGQIAEKRYTGMWQCMREIVKYEGVRGLYKGLWPGMIKAAMTTALSMWFYEVISLALALRYSTQEQDDEDAQGSHFHDHDD